MSRSPRRILFVLFGLGVLGAGAWWGTGALRAFMREDALADLRYQQGKSDPEVQMQMEDVVLRHYDAGKLIHQAKVGKFTVTRDRRVTRATDVTEGKVLREGQPAFEYTATEANWDDYAKKLFATGTIRVMNKDLRFSTSELQFDEAADKVVLAKPIVGVIYGGSMKAASFEADLKTKAYRATNIVWQGQAKPEVVNRPPRRWNVKATTFTALNEDQIEYMKPEATDGEIAVRAEKGSWDRKKDIFVATGGVRYFSREVNLIAEKVTIYRKERRAVLEGRVTMLIKPEDERKLEIVELQPLRPIVPEEVLKTRPTAPKASERDREVRDLNNRRRYPVRVTASAIEYFYGDGNRRANISGSPQARQELDGGRWRQIWAHSAVWNGESDVLTLSSATGAKSVRFMTSLGDDLRARSATVSTKEGEERYSISEAEGEVYSDDEDDIPRPDPPVSGPI